MNQLALVSPGERDLGAEMVVPSVKHLPHKHANMSSVAQNTWKRLDMTALTWIPVWGKAMKMEGPQSLPATQGCRHEFSGPERMEKAGRDSTHLDPHGGRAGKMEGPQCLLARQSSCISELQRETLSQQKMVSNEGGTRHHQLLASACKRISMHTCIYTQHQKKQSSFGHLFYLNSVSMWLQNWSIFLNFFS